MSNLDKNPSYIPNYVPPNGPAVDLSNSNTPIYLKSSNVKVKYIEAYKRPDQSVYSLIPVLDWDQFSRQAPQSKTDIEWSPYNYATYIDHGVQFSFEMPYPGPYCEGCFDGWPHNGQSSNVEGISISGGHFLDNADDSWILTAGIVYLHSPTVENSLETNTYLPQMIEAMINTAVGNRVAITDRYNQSEYSAIRLSDVLVNEKRFFKFSTTNPNEKYYALLDEGGYVIVFSYTFTGEIYDIFDTLLNSFQPVLRDDAVYGSLPPVESLDGFEMTQP